ncbi:DUF2796 domain-containing protein [Pseudomonas citri]|uniref:DUF2796 domain-containing protein n=1 Tax=Pseudomonas citri TaxID=2978349 RepID=UPI0021B5A15D|nr:DUF2796 domain-containing protein [Pseudomonas citri]
MRRLLLALPFALLPLAVAHAAVEHDHDHEHGSLGAHEHGVARLNASLDGEILELELDSPAMNLVGFEHAATSDADKAKVAAIRAKLEKPAALINLADAKCSLEQQELESPLFGDEPGHEEHAEEADEDGHEHSEIHAHYQFRCVAPGSLTHLNLAPLFQIFPATQKVLVQLVGPNGQQGGEVTAAAPTLKF